MIQSVVTVITIYCKAIFLAATLDTNLQQEIWEQNPQFDNGMFMLYVKSKLYQIFTAKVNVKPHIWCKTRTGTTWACT